MTQTESSIRTALTIGNFDGAHLGHAALIRAAQEAVQFGVGGRVVALCFDPNPATILHPGSEPPRLMTFEQRRERLIELGADAVERLVPTSEFLAQSPEQFIAWLIEKHHPIAIVEGPDFRFGHRRAGSIDTLRTLGTTHGFEMIVVQPIEVVLMDQSLVRASSSMVRWLVARGRVRDARHVLGRPYELCGQIVKGDQRGRDLGVPTANLELAPDLLLPADGIYMGVANAPDGKHYTAAISVGTKPTFGEHPRICEAHLIDYHGSLNEYGWTMRLEFHNWMRNQLTYNDVQPLMEQLQRDIVLARRISRTPTLQHEHQAKVRSC